MGKLVDFPERKVDRSIADYVYSAQKGHPILQRGLSHAGLQNAIPGAIERARDKAAEAKRSAGKAKRRANFLFGVGVLSVLAALGTLVSHLLTTRASLQTTLGLVNTTNSKLEDQARTAQKLEWQLRALSARYEEHLRLERARTSNLPTPPEAGRGQPAR